MALPFCGFLVVRRITPKVPRAPYTAVDEASLSTVIDSMSSGFTVDMSVSTPSTITRAEPPEPIEFSAPRMRTVAPRLGLPSEKVIVRPGMAPCNEREMLIDEPMRSSRPFVERVSTAPTMSRRFCTP